MRTKKKVVKRNVIIFYEEDQSLLNDLYEAIKTEEKDFQKIIKQLINEAIIFRQNNYKIIDNEIFRKEI